MLDAFEAVDSIRPHSDAAKRRQGKTPFSASKGYVRRITCDKIPRSSSNNYLVAGTYCCD